MLWRASGQISAVEVLQFYSDKSHTSIKLSAFIFYLVHITLQNLRKDAQNLLIKSAKSVIGYLLTMFEDVKSSENVSIGIS